MAPLREPVRETQPVTKKNMIFVVPTITMWKTFILHCQSAVREGKSSGFVWKTAINGFYR